MAAALGLAEQHRVAGRPGDVVLHEAVPIAAFFATMGRRAGIDPWQLYQGQRLGITRQLPESLRGLSDQDLDALLGRGQLGPSRTRKRTRPIRAGGRPSCNRAIGPGPPRASRWRAWPASSCPSCSAARPLSPMAPPSSGRTASSRAAMEDAAGTTALIEAVRAVVRQRDSGQPLHFALEQADAFGGGLSADARAFHAAFLHRDPKTQRSRLLARPRLGKLLEAYVEEAGRHEGESLLGTDRPTPGQIVAAVDKRARKELGELLAELGLDPETATAADIRAAMGAESATGGPAAAPEGGEGATLFQRMIAGLDLDREVTIIDAPDLGLKARNAKKHIPKVPEEGIENLDTRRKLKFSRTAAEHAISSFVKSVDMAEAHLDSTVILPQLLKRAIRVEEHADRKGRREIRRVHRFFAAMRHRGTVYAVKLTVRETVDGPDAAEVDGVYRFYDERLVRQVDQPASSAAVAREGDLSPPPHTDAPRSAEAASVTLRDLLQGVKDDEGQPYFQAPQGTDPRGSITFLPDGRTLIQLFAKANLSTVLHEAGHLFLKVYGTLASGERAAYAKQAEVLRRNAGRMILQAPHRYFAPAPVPSGAAKVSRGRGGNHFPHILFTFFYHPQPAFPLGGRRR